MLLSCFQKGRTIWCFRLRSSSKTCKQHWFRSVSAAIFNRTEGRRCVRSFVKLPHEFYAVCVSVSWCLLEHTMIPGHKCVLFALPWLGCAWQFLTCVMSGADTESMGPIGSRKVAVKLQESMLTAFVLTSCISQGFKAPTVHTACPWQKKKKKLQVQIKQDNYLVWCHRADDFFSAPASQLQQNIWHMNRMKPVSLLMARRTQTEWNWLQKITFLSPIQKLILDIRNSSW